MTKKANARGNSGNSAMSRISEISLGQFFMNKIIITFVILCVVSIAHSQVPNTLSNEDKVYGLSKFWQEVNYNFVYLERINRSTWDSTYRALITAVQKTENDYQYYRALQKFCAMLHDGHTNVNFPPSIDSLIMRDMFGKYRIFLTNIDNKAIVTWTNLSIKDEIPIGSEVVKVNGLATQDYIAQFVAPYFSSSTSYVLQDLCVSNLLQGLKGDCFEITLKTPNGKLKQFLLTHERTSEQEVYPPFEKEDTLNKLLQFKWYDHQIAYLALNSFGDPKIDTLFQQCLPDLYKAKALIIDLRNNGGGSTDIGTSILQYLTPDTILYGSKQTSRIHIPSYKAWGAYIKPEDTTGNDWAKKSLLHFQDKAYYTFDYSPETTHVLEKKVVVPTVLLIGHNTCSAAEDFLIYADNQKHMTKIGENSFGSTGQPYIFELPGGGSARVCTKKDTYPDGREFVGYGVKPDIEVIPTVQHHLRHNDPVLNRALEFLRRKSK
jgi:C-terminal processing protease CtpA/Prc